jgi:hypothetical protein
MGINPARVARVIALVNEVEESHQYKEVAIEYLACVPVFDSYKNDAGEKVRYLARVDYYGRDASLSKAGSLLEYFDENDSQGKNKNQATTMSLPCFYGISGVAIGGGIESEEDISQIKAFVENMGGRRIPIEPVMPNPEFRTMHEELNAFKAMGEHEKEEATRQYTMGPAKVAKFARDLAYRLIDDAYQAIAKDATVATVSDGEQNPLMSEEDERDTVVESRILDPVKNRYACRKCRYVLFGEDDLESPPHVPSKHKFSHRKHDAASHHSSCQSLFLHSAIDWMGRMDTTEGKLSCPNCETKVGVWNWSGAQCSCGSWIAPAIQIPLSRIDVVPPYRSGLPIGAVVSPVLKRIEHCHGMAIIDKT